MNVEELITIIIGTPLIVIFWAYIEGELPKWGDIRRDWYWKTLHIRQRFCKHDWHVSLFQHLHDDDSLSFTCSKCNKHETFYPWDKEYKR